MEHLRVSRVSSSLGVLTILDNPEHFPDNYAFDGRIRRFATVNMDIFTVSY